MKALLSLLFFTIIFSGLFAQNSANRTDFTTNKWKVGKTVTINNHSILRVSGSGGFFSPTITNIKYTSQAQLLSDAKQKADQEMWTEQQRLEKLNYYEQYSGRIDLYIVRSTIDAANTRFFTIIVKDKDGVEIGRSKFSESLPDYSVTSAGTYWYNYGYCYILITSKPPFFVYIIDQVSEPTQHCFKIIN